MTFSDVRTLQPAADLVDWCSQAIESAHRRQEALQARIAAFEELIAIAAGPAAARGGSISWRALLLAVDGDDREHVRDLLRRVGLLLEEG